MSAYVVDDETIVRIVTYFQTDGSNHPIMRGRVYCLLMDAGYIISDEQEARRLAKDLFDMNVTAVCQRYSDESPDNYAFDWVSVPIPSAVQAVKSLDCYLYQCSEGNVPDQPLYKVVNQICGIICGGIVRASREYDKAEWA